MLALLYFPTHDPNISAPHAALLSPLQSHTETPFCFGLVCGFFQGKADVYLAPWRRLSCTRQSQAWPEQPELQVNP